MNTLVPDVGFRLVANGPSAAAQPVANTIDAEVKSRMEGLRVGMLRHAELVTNLIASRSQFLQSFLDPRRDIDEECGYPLNIEPNGYRRMYERDAVAARVVEVYPKETWQVLPEVYEDEDPDTQTPFEEDWSTLGKNLMGSEDSWHQEQEGSIVWDYLRRLDVVTGIGRYGLLFLGVDDGRPLDQPVRPRLGMKLQYLRVFPEYLAPVGALDTDETSPRFGQPVTYNIQFGDPKAATSAGIVGPTSESISRSVHWSRVVHCVDSPISSEWVAPPRMQQVWNRLMDLYKLYGGSAEMYWKGALPGIALETHPQLGGDVDIDVDSTKRFMSDYMNGLQRYLLLAGMSAKTLAPTVVDPSAQIKVQLEAICIKLGVPIRVFMGSERGELASTQDDAAWHDRLRDRQRTQVTPRIIVQFVNRLLSFGVLRPVKDRKKGYFVSWPDMAAQTQQDKASVAVSRTQALAAYANSNIQAILTPRDFFVSIMQFTVEEAKMIIKHAEDAQVDGFLMDQGLNTPATGTGTGARLLNPAGNGTPGDGRVSGDGGGSVSSNPASGRGQPPTPPNQGNAVRTAASRNRTDQNQ